MTSTATLLSRGLLGLFVASVTLWYFLSPYGVRPHPQFQLDMEKFIAQNRKMENANADGRWIENWTKWKLQLGGEGGPVIFPQQRLSIDNMSLPLSAVFEWRSEYKAELVEAQGGDLEVILNHPSASVGLYNHYNVKVESGKHVMFMPLFMFGLQQHVLDQMYGGADGIPTIGMMADSTGGDRIIVQCFMNLVIVTVILLLWANNPPTNKSGEDKED